MRAAGAIRVAGPALLRRRRRKRFYKLQAVSQADLAQGDATVGVNILKAGHASLPAVLPVGENSCASSSERSAEESAPSTCSCTPPPIPAPFTAIGRTRTPNTS